MKEISHCLAVVMPILHIILSVHNSLRKNKKEREKGTSDGEGGGSHYLGNSSIPTQTFPTQKRFPQRCKTVQGSPSGKKSELDRKKTSGIYVRGGKNGSGSVGLLSLLRCGEVVTPTINAHTVF